MKASLLYVLVLTDCLMGATVGRSEAVELERIAYPLRVNSFYNHIDHARQNGIADPRPLSFVLKCPLPNPPKELMVYREKEDTTATPEKKRALVEQFGFPFEEMTEFNGDYFRKYGREKQWVTFWHGTTSSVRCDYVPNFYSDGRSLDKELTEEKGVRIAEEFLRSHGFWLDSLKLLEVGYGHYGNITHLMRVVFMMSFGPYEAMSTGIQVWLTGAGTVKAVSIDCREWVPFKEYPVITPEEAIREIQEGYGIEGTQCPWYIAPPVEINEVKLWYTGLDTSKSPCYVFMSPIYSLFGTGKVRDVDTEVVFHVPAVKREYLRPVLDSIPGKGWNGGEGGGPLAGTESPRVVPTAIRWIETPVPVPQGKGKVTKDLPAGFVPKPGTGGEPYTRTGFPLEIVHEKTGMEMIFIPGGKYLMGAGKPKPPEHCDGQPQHEVTVKSFYMARYEVTNAQYKVYATETGKPESGCMTWTEKMPSVKDTWGPEYPALCVSWEDARAFCAWAGMRLPSEAEWERACRAGTTTTYYFGTDERELDDYAWQGTSVGNQPHPVGQKKPNAWGLYDMYGNADEWCEDIWHEKYVGAPTDGSAWVIGGDPDSRPARGGGWVSTAIGRSASRTGYLTDFGGPLNGFRPVVSVP